MHNFNLTEILSPVGNEEMLIAAVRSGADAVYLGAKDFSARRNAENFGREELKKAVDYCHIRGVKVYLTLNILIKDHEMSAAFDLAKSAYDMGIDGIIIEDLGLAQILREKIPALPLHASTQMTVHSPSALNFLKEKGFSRVVAAREMSKKELIELCNTAKKLDMEIEAFVHGALCMCMSGQCLLSAFLGSRSGNRGLCAGPCRLPFKVKGGTGYDLSLKDLSLMDYIWELAEIGVCSFKIEGRMKRPEYVAAATAACRQALDKGEVEEKLEETLQNVFARSGFTDGYYHGKLGKDMFGIRTKDDVVSADKAFPYLHELYRRERQNINISVTAEILNNKPVSITLSDGENTAQAFGNEPQPAQKRPLTNEDVFASINKFGGTPYLNKGGVIRLDEGLFVSAGDLNSLRRQAVEKLDAMRSMINREEVTEEYIPYKKSRKIKEINLIARFEKADSIPENLSGIKAVMLPLEENPNIKIADEIVKIVDIPRGIVSEKLLKERLILFKENGFNIAACGNLAAVEIAKSLEFDILADTGLNITNSETVKTFESYGIKAGILSTELTIEEAEKISGNIPLGIIIYGSIPLMLFRNCPIKNGIDCTRCDKKGVITDRLGVSFPVRCRMGYSEMLNSVPIWLADKMNEFNLDFGVLYFTGESKERAAEVISAYKEGYGPDVKYTRGLYFRGVN